MAWQILFSTRDAFEAATTPPEGADTAQYDLARQLARQILDSGHVPVLDMQRFAPEHGEKDATAERATVRIALSGHAGDPASLSVSVSQA